MNFANGFEQFGAFRALEEVAVCACGQGTEDIFCIFINCEHDDLKFGNELFQLADAFDAVDAREIDVHKDNFGTDPGNLLDGFFGGAVVAEALEAISAVQDAGERVSQLLVVFDDGDGYGHDKKEVLPGDSLTSNADSERQRSNKKREGPDVALTGIPALVEYL